MRSPGASAIGVIGIDHDRNRALLNARPASRSTRLVDKARLRSSALLLVEDIDAGQATRWNPTDLSRRAADGVDLAHLKTRVASLLGAASTMLDLDPGLPNGSEAATCSTP